jgi:hypothetical protein
MRSRNITSLKAQEIEKLELQLREAKAALEHLQAGCGSTYGHDYRNGVCFICQKKYKKGEKMDTHAQVMKTIKHYIESKNIAYDLSGDDGNAEVLRFIFGMDFEEALFMTEFSADHLALKDKSRFSEGSFARVVEALFERGGTAAKGQWTQVLHESRYAEDNLFPHMRINFDKIPKQWEDFLNMDYSMFMSELLQKGTPEARKVLESSLAVANQWNQRS